jgi:hypothetical protein
MGQSSALAARVLLQLLLVLAASRPRAGGSLALIPSACVPLEMLAARRAFAWRRFQTPRQKKVQTDP